MADHPQVRHVEEDQIKLRVVGHPAESSPAERARKGDDVAFERHRCVGSVEEHAVPIPEVAAEGGVLRRQIIKIRAGIERHSRQGLGLERERLRLRRVLARNDRLRDGPLLEPEYRLARDPVEHEQQSHLRDLRHGRDHIATAAHVDQRGERRRIVVPEVVVDELLMPFQRAGLRIERHE